MTESARLSARKSAAVARGVTTRGIYAIRAENAELWDAEGRRFLDFAAGIAVQNSINIPPSLRKAQGAEVSIFVAQDLDFSGVYQLRTR